MELQNMSKNDNQPKDNHVVVINQQTNQRPNQQPINDDLDAPGCLYVWAFFSFFFFPFACCASCCYNCGGGLPPQQKRAFIIMWLAAVIGMIIWFGISNLTKF